MIENTVRRDGLNRAAMLEEFEKIGYKGELWHIFWDACRWQLATCADETDVRNARGKAAASDAQGESSPETEEECLQRARLADANRETQRHAAFVQGGYDSDFWPVWQSGCRWQREQYNRAEDKAFEAQEDAERLSRFEALVSGILAQYLGNAGDVSTCAARIREALLESDLLEEKADE